MMRSPGRLLTNALIVKAIVEALFVVGLAVFAFLTMMPPDYRGNGDLNNSVLTGWVVDPAAPSHRVDIQLFVDGKFTTSAIASESRPDVVANGWANDEWHGYTFRLSPLSAGPHEARVYALHGSGDASRKTLRLVGAPIRFSVDETGRTFPTLAR